MDSYEYDDRKLGMAVTRLMTSKSVIHNFGKPIYPENMKLQYVWCYIGLNLLSYNGPQGKIEKRLSAAKP